MEDIRPNSVTSFDTQYTTNHIRMFKVLLRFLEPSMQSKLAIYIKFMELQYTITLSHTLLPQTALTDCPFPASESTYSVPDFEQICDELIPYCEPQEKQQFLQIRNLLESLHNMQNMMELLESMKELFPEGMNTGDGQSGLNPEMFAAMSNMFGSGNMDFSAMAELFSGG